MNDQQLVAEGWGAYSVIAVSFEDDRNAYNALTSLKELDSHQRVGVQEAVVVVRGEDGVEMDRVGVDVPPQHGRRRTHRPAHRDHRRTARHADRVGQWALPRVAVRPGRHRPERSRRWARSRAASRLGGPHCWRLCAS